MTVQALIGPNAATQLYAAVTHKAGNAMANRLFREADLAAWIDDPPTARVDEALVARLHQTMRHIMPPAAATALAIDAGQRTAGYIITNRMPGPIKALMQIMPKGLAARMLLAGIQQNAWTFVGSGSFKCRYGRPIHVAITNNPVVRGEVASRPICDWHRAVFAGLFNHFLNSAIDVQETSCCAMGARSCNFLIHH